MVSFRAEDGGLGSNSAGRISRAGNGIKAKCAKGGPNSLDKPKTTQETLDEPRMTELMVDSKSRSAESNDEIDRNDSVE